MGNPLQIKPNSNKNVTGGFRCILDGKNIYIKKVESTKKNQHTNGRWDLESGSPPVAPGTLCDDEPGAD